MRFKTRRSDGLYGIGSVMFGLKKKQDNDTLKNAVIAALKMVFDPEIPVNIYDLGLVYDVAINESQQVHIQMTLTSPGCPVAQTFPGTVEQAVNQVEGVSDCTVELVWDPPWTQERMSEVAKLELGIFY
jgi:FeS assembly SUF system protein